MRTILNVMCPEKQYKPVKARVEALSSWESGHAVPFSPQDFCSPCVFVYCWHNTGSCWPGSASCGCLLHTPNWGPGPQPKHMLWLGIKLMTVWFTGRHSIHWATSARRWLIFYDHFSATINTFLQYDCLRLHISLYGYNIFCLTILLFLDFKKMYC